MKPLHRAEVCISGILWSALTAEDVGGRMKGIAAVELADSTICEAEIHWYEAYGIR